jgi:hypothetical protein
MISVGSISGVLSAAMLLLAQSVGLTGQTLLPRSSVQYATFTASSSTASVAPGGSVTLWVDVQPNRSIHIYAAGARDFTPISLVLTPASPLKAGRAVYPKPDVATAPGSTGDVPAYQRPFRIALPVTIASSARPATVVSIGGAVKYQACDDRLCYPATVAPVSWSVTVK